MIDRPNLLAGEDLPPAPHQKRSLEKRTRLKTAALAAFREKGYEGTSIEEIARRAELATGGFYLHFRSKRQLLLTLMDELLDGMSKLDLRPESAKNVREALHSLLSNAFSKDLEYLGAYRAWREAALTDADLAHKQDQIHQWTRSRVRAVFTMLQRSPNARHDVDIDSLAMVMDSFFWNLMAQAATLRPTELKPWIDSATHLVYHALIADS